MQAVGVAVEVDAGASAQSVRRLDGAQRARGVDCAGVETGPGLERRLAELTRGRAPLRRGLARVAGRLVVTRAWERLGFARLADYARERPGLSARQLQDLAHVDRRLAELPALEAALLRDELSWSKARLLARVATPEDEARWVEFARTSSVRALAREVRAVDRGSLEWGGLELDEDGATVDAREWVIVRCTRRSQGKFHRARAVARRVAGENLPPWACMEAVAAEALSALGLDAGEEETDAPEGPEDATEDAAEAASWPREAAPARGAALRRARGSSEPPANVCAPQAPADPLRFDAAARRELEPAASPALDALLRGLEEADAFELDARLCRAVAMEQRVEAALAALLRRAFDAGLHRRRGFASFDAFVRERLALSPRKARALLRLGRAAAAHRSLREAFGAGRLSWVKCQVLLPLFLAPEAAAFRARWLACAERTTVRRLEEEVDAALLLLSTDRDAFLAHGGAGGPSERPTCAQPRATAGTSTPQASPVGAPILPSIDDVLTRSLYDDPEAETSRFMFLAPRDVARLFRAVLCSVRRGLERAAGGPVSPGRAAEWMLDHAFDAWGANDPRVRREHRVFDRDGWRCTVPGCTSYRNLHDHHVRFRSAGGSDELANRTTLCAFHHLRGVHAGRVRCLGEAPHRLRFELGLRPEQPPLLVYEPGERLAVTARGA